jgi:hypothetical protein
MGERRDAFTPTRTLRRRGGGQALCAQAGKIPPTVSSPGGRGHALIGGVATR